jgi:hypothetical protein
LDDSKIIKENKKLIENNLSKIKELALELREIENKVNVTNLSSEEILTYDYLRVLQDKLEDITYKILYYKQPIKETGRLTKNKDGRYDLPSGAYFTSGDLIEVKIYDDWFEKERWFKSTVEHDGKDYYIVGAKDIKMEGILARQRKMYDFF